MNNTRQHPFSARARLFLMAALVVTLMLGAGQAAFAATLAPVNLGKASSFVILTKSGITNVPTSKITGDMGVSPIASTAVTGFALVRSSTGTYSQSSQVTGKVYAANYTSPTPANLTTAISNMQTAYADAAGRKNPDFTELYAGDISGKTLVPGLYKWGTSVVANSNVTLNGGPTAVWIFQISGNLTVASGVMVTLSGGAQAKNIFWQVAGGAGVTLGTTSHFQGTILTATAIHLLTGACLNGRALAQTAVTLDHNMLVIPATK
ncbi:MAG: ice-binding family protein [Anaerolineae bacterium]